MKMEQEGYSDDTVQDVLELAWEAEVRLHIISVDCDELKLDMKEFIEEAEWIKRNSM